MRLAVWPGEGLVQRAGETVLVALGGPEDEAALTALAETCRARHGAELARALAGTVLGGDAERLPTFAVLTASGQGLLVFCRGDIEVRATTAEGPMRVSGRGVVTWVEQALAGDVASVVIGPPDAPADRARPWADLRAGVVPGAGATLVPMVAALPSEPARQPEPAPAAAPLAPASPPPAAPAPPAAPPAPAPSAAPVAAPADAGSPAPPAAVADRIGAPETPPGGVPPIVIGSPPAGPAPPAPPSDPVPFQAVLIQGGPADLAGRAPLPVPSESAPHEPEPEHDHAHDHAADGTPPAILVPGVRCSRNHHNSPAAIYCSSCGIRMGAHLTLNLVQGPRPPLGVLVFDDGSTIPVRHDMIIGREPALDELVRAGTALAIRVEDDTSSVSRAHLQVVLDGWDVLIGDRGSSNGTFVKLRGEEEWRRLQASERVRLVTGSEVRAGDRRFVFEQHHVA